MTIEQNTSPIPKNVTWKKKKKDLLKKWNGMFILIEIFNLAMLSYFHFNNTSYFHSVKQKMELNKVKKVSENDVRLFWTEPKKIS